MPPCPAAPGSAATTFGVSLSKSRVEALLVAFRSLRPKDAPWVVMDADDNEAWWHDVLNDPRARRTQADRIPKDHVDASLRLDRWPGAFVTFRCMTCGAHASYEARDLAGVFGGDANITRLPTSLVDCPEKLARREGACRLRAEGGPHVGMVRRVRRP
jgi:hypothetical protein